MNFITELKWRGMIHDIMPGTEDQFNDEMTTAYIGFDPTADSLHVGSLVQIMTLVHLQKSGHKPIILVGGATGMVGQRKAVLYCRLLVLAFHGRANAEIVRVDLVGLHSQCANHP